MTILPVNKAQSLVVAMRNKFGKAMEVVYTFSINFEVVVVD